MIPYFVFDKIILGDLTIYAWGLMASLGILLALLISLREANKKNVNKQIVWDLILIILLGGITGSRGAYILWHWNEFEENFIKIFFLWEGGLSSIGGIILAALLALWYVKRKKLNLWKTADLLTPGIISAVFFTRIGCFLIYDHVGRITNLPWGRLYFDGTIRHPVILYHIISCAIIFFIACYLKTKRLKNGILFLISVSCYIIFRFSLDFLRCSDLIICNSRFLYLTHTQWILIGLFPIVVYFVFTKK